MEVDAPCSIVAPHGVWVALTLTACTRFGGRLPFVHIEVGHGQPLSDGILEVFDGVATTDVEVKASATPASHRDDTRSWLLSNPKQAQQALA
jgi:hypothetical protein